MSTNEPSCTPYHADTGDDDTEYYDDCGRRTLHAWSFADGGRPPRPLSRDGSVHVTDEVINSISHLAAAMMSVLGLVLLVVQSGGNPWKIVAFSVYGTSLVNLFVCSTLHHSINSTERAEARLRLLDYAAIYPLIAGTFTPFCLVVLHDTPIGWAFFGVAWGLALLGIAMTAVLGVERIPRWLSMTLYITLGWLGVFMACWLVPALGLAGLSVFVMGGIFYTAGGYVYVTEVPNPYPGRFGFHEIWHIAVILGAGFHYACMYFFVLPWEPYR